MDRRGAKIAMHPAQNRGGGRAGELLVDDGAGQRGEETLRRLGAEGTAADALHHFAEQGVGLAQMATRQRGVIPQAARREREAVMPERYLRGGEDDRARTRARHLPGGGMLGKQGQGEEIGEHDPEAGKRAHRSGTLEGVGAGHRELSPAAAQAGPEEVDRTLRVGPAPGRQREEEHGDQPGEREVQDHRLVALAGADAAEPDHRHGVGERAQRRHQHHGPGERERRLEQGDDAGEGQGERQPEPWSDLLSQQGSREQRDEDRSGGREGGGVGDSDPAGAEREERADGGKGAVAAPPAGADPIDRPERRPAKDAEADGDEGADQEAGRRDLGPGQVGGPEPRGDVHHGEAELRQDHPAQPGGHPDGSSQRTSLGEVFRVGPDRRRRVPFRRRRGPDAQT